MSTVQKTALALARLPELLNSQAVDKTNGHSENSNPSPSYYWKSYSGELRLWGSYHIAVKTAILVEFNQKHLRCND
jgi:hypothetical protein